MFFSRKVIRHFNNLAKVINAKTINSKIRIDRYFVAPGAK